MPFLKTQFSGDELINAVAETSDDFIKKEIFPLVLVGTQRLDSKLIDFLAKKPLFYDGFQAVMEGLKDEQFRRDKIKSKNKFFKPDPKVQVEAVSYIIMAGLRHQNQGLIGHFWSHFKKEFQMYIRQNLGKIDEKTWTWLSKIGKEKNHPGLSQYITTKKRESLQVELEKPAYDSLPPLNEKRMQSEDSSLSQTLTQETELPHTKKNIK